MGEEIIPEITNTYCGTDGKEAIVFVTAPASWTINQVRAFVAFSGGYSVKKWNYERMYVRGSKTEWKFWNEGVAFVIKSPLYGIYATHIT